jgi:hypothetical protein
MHRLETAVPFPHAHETDNITKHVSRLCKARVYMLRAGLVTLQHCTACDVFVRLIVALLVTLQTSALFSWDPGSNPVRTGSIL